MSYMSHGWTAPKKEPKTHPNSRPIVQGRRSRGPLQTRASGARFQPPHLEIRSAVPVVFTITT